MKNAIIKGQTKEEIKALLQIVGGDEGALLFLSEWMANGGNATKAYLKINPNVSYASARVLGSKQLTKINIADVFAAYGLGMEEYIKKLKEGLNAKTGNLIKKYDKQGNLVSELDTRKPDFKVRRLYHQALGEALGIEGVNPKTQVNNQLNIAAIFEGMERDRKLRGLPAI